jgi:hypothetical protein
LQQYLLKAVISLEFKLITAFLIVAQSSCEEIKMMISCGVTIAFMILQMILKTVHSAGSSA